ncbi:hypothetical protein CANARDRAFT_222685 [[Candida] arabinofermentans NRRL YB-2248]|uniref:Uncharacterized protein n=1 Tax=[Candida] arabinofermentans NRRL YB-2248 TaxID=983967 RepID=A0A1E4SYW6_9ASCO|nr:hypothetical protein CANARDRAFT_222685 [[Candida] arabinofermentans NRRL YB-2248]
MTNLSPDEMVDAIIEHLCVSDPNGVPISDIWNFCTERTALLDDFTKKLIWSWLIKEPDFLITSMIPAVNRKKKPITKILDKSEFKDYNKANTADTRLTVDSERASLFLLGIKKENSAIGVNPYELLRVIARSKEIGIVSPDLITQTGQDRRSLTSRLQTLIDMGLVKKYHVVHQKTRTYRMVHFRYEDKIVVPQDKSISQLAKDVVTELKKAPNGIRITADLANELGIQKSSRRRLASVIRFLASHGILARLIVEHENTLRRFRAVQYIKDLPSNTETLGHLSENVVNSEGKDEDDDEDIDADADSTAAVVSQNLTQEESSSIATPEIPMANRFTPYQNQLYDIVERSPGISTTQLNEILSGRLSAKGFSLLLASFAVESPDPDKKYQVIKVLQYKGKQRFFRHFTYLELVREQHGNQNMLPRASFGPLVGDSTKSLADFSLTLAAYRPQRRCIPVLIDRDCYKFYWFSYSGDILPQLIADQQINMFVLDEGIELRTGGKRKQQTKEGKNSHIAKERQKNYEEALIKEEPDSGASRFLSSFTQFDAGPVKRRELLLKHVNDAKCCVKNLELARMIGTRLNIDYKIDVKTIQRDAEHLSKRGLLRIEQIEGKECFLSILNPPTNAEIENALVTTFNRVATRETPILDTSKPILKVNDKHFFKVPPFKEKELAKTEMLRDVEDDENESKLVDPEIPKKDSTKDSKKRKRGNANNPDGDVFTPIMENRKRKRLGTQKTRHHVAIPTSKKSRSTLKLANRDIMSLIRAVIISQSLSTSLVIDWTSIAELFGNKYEPLILRRQWPRHKRIIGVRGIEHSKKVWENILLKSIEKGDVTEDDLLEPDYSKLVTLWREVDSNSFKNTADVFLYKNYDENFKYQSFKTDFSPKGLDLFREATTLVEKEDQFATIPTTYPCSEKNPPLDNEPSELSKARTKLKALFATDSSHFTSEKAKQVFSSTSNSVYTTALTELEDQKAIAYLGESSPVRFTLTDRALYLIDWKFDEWFFKSAASFFETTQSLSLNSKGMILSPLSPDGIFVSLIQLLATDKLDVVRVDQMPPRLESNYSTKSHDKKKLESDFIVSKLKNEDEEDALLSVPLPTGPPCSLLWIDLNGEFNRTIWFKAVSKLLSIIVFKPGVSLKLLALKLDPLFEYFEVKVILDWLVAKNSVKGDPWGGYWAQPLWYLTFHG